MASGANSYKIKVLARRVLLTVNGQIAANSRGVVPVGQITVFRHFIGEYNILKQKLNIFKV